MAGPGRRPATTRGPRGALPGEALAALVAAAVVVLAAVAGPLVVRWHDPPAWFRVTWQFEPPPTAEPAPTQPAQDVTPVDGPAWVGAALRWLGIALVTALVAWLVRLVVRALRERWQAIDLGPTNDAEPGGAAVGDPLDEAAQEALEEAVARAGRALRAELPPGDAVVAAWLALEGAAGDCGIERDPAQTASEFTLALLDRTPADPRAARTLLRLYHAARFSEHEVTAADVAAADAALRTLAAGLASAVTS